MEPDKSDGAEFIPVASPPLNGPDGESDLRFRNILLQWPGNIAIFEGLDMVIGFANEPMLRSWKTDVAAVGKPLLEVLPEMEVRPFLDLLLEVYTTGRSYQGYEEKLLLQDNDDPADIYYDYVCHPVLATDGTVTGVSVMATDVTERVSAKRIATSGTGYQMADIAGDSTTRKRVEEALRLAREESEARKRVYEAVTNNTPDLIYVFDLQYRFTYANKALLTMWGKTWEQAIGRSLLENGYEPWHAEMHEREIDRVVVTRQSIRGEVSFPHALLGKRIYDYIFVPVVNGQGEVEAVAGTTRDITDIRQAEAALQQSREQLEALVEERTKALHRSNEDLQQFAHVASHDMKEPVRKMLVFADLLKEEYQQQLNGKGQIYLNKILESARRIYSLIDGILSFSSFQVTEPQAGPVDLNDIVRDIENDLEMVIRQKQASIRYEGLPTIDGFPLLIFQLFSNLVSNALKFTREASSPVIRITAAPAPAQEVQAAGLDGRRAYTKIMLRDNGIGFDQQYAERIFQTFSRLNTKDRFEGTGLGLALCRKIVERHGGAIRASGKENEGAMFTIILPLQQQQQEADQAVSSRDSMKE